MNVLYPHQTSEKALNWFDERADFEHNTYQLTTQVPFNATILEESAIYTPLHHGKHALFEAYPFTTNVIFTDLNWQQNRCTFQSGAEDLFPAAAIGNDNMINYWSSNSAREWREQPSYSGDNYLDSMFYDSKDLGSSSPRFANLYSAQPLSNRLEPRTDNQNYNMYPESTSPSFSGLSSTVDYSSYSRKSMQDLSATDKTRCYDLMIDTVRNHPSKKHPLEQPRAKVKKPTGRSSSSKVKKCTVPPLSANKSRNRTKHPCVGCASNKKKVRLSESLVFLD